MGVQKGSLYSHIESKADLLWEVAARGRRGVPRRRSTRCPTRGRRVERIRLALRAHLRVVAEQLDIATVFVREWRYLEGERREEFVAERRRYEERFRALFREGRERGELRTDLDDGAAALLVLSAANWAYTWLRPARTPTRSPTASPRSCSTACAATSMPLIHRPDRDVGSVRDTRGHRREAELSCLLRP